MNTAIDYGALPPMLQQYREYKQRMPDALLLFQVGDFYETFFEDAITVSQALNLTLTSRDKNSANPIPMAGVPVGVIEGYIERLVDQGYSVALVSQIEGQSSAGRGMFERKLERVITPGVRVLGGEAGGDSGRPLAAYIPAPNGDGAVATMIVESGIVEIREGINGDSLASELAAIDPAELVVPRDGGFAQQYSGAPWLNGISLKVRAAPHSDSASRAPSELAAISGYARLSASAKAVVRLLLTYVDETTVDGRVAVRQARPRGGNSEAGIDAMTRANLELVRNQRDGGVEGTLFGLLKVTVTAGGARTLRQALLRPLTDMAQICARHSVVELLLRRFEDRRAITDLLRKCSDIERIAARLDLDRAGPREIAGLRDTLEIFPELQRILQQLAGEAEESGRQLVHQMSAALAVSSAVRELLLSAVADNPPLTAREGGLIRAGYDPQVDELRDLRCRGESWINELEASARSETGVAGLRIRQNNVLGRYFEVSKSQASKVPGNYVRRQSTSTTERFITDELREREKRLLAAESDLFERERALFEDIRKQAAQHTEELRQAAGALALVDMLTAFAEIAAREDYVRPQLRDEPVLVIEQGRHPVLSHLLRGKFVPNSLRWDADNRGCIVTGPNMGGKSTFLRQAALLTVMAQCGSFVAARRAVVGIADQIFARLGASDNLYEGESTFMVEMREASHILAHATERSLVLIDEIGRGTATADGIAIARSILEWIMTRIGCRLLFATHFHELTGLVAHLKGLSNLSVNSHEVDGDVVFTHEIREGAASESYGIEVARLAGLPEQVVARARDVLAMSHVQTDARRQLSIFGSAPLQVKERIPADYEMLAALKAKLDQITPDDLSPREALDVLYTLKTAVKSR